MVRPKNQLDSFSCSVNLSQASLAFKPLQIMMGISDKSLGKPFRAWSIEDRRIWKKFQTKISPHFFVDIRYLPSENCFFISTQTSSKMISLNNKAIIYSAVLLEEQADSPLGRHVEIRLYTRIVPELGWCFTAAAYWNNGAVDETEQEEFKILCDMPLAATQDWSEQIRASMNQLGFEVEWDESLESHEDEFGDQAYYPNLLSYARNGVTFTLD